MAAVPTEAYGRARGGKLSPVFHRDAPKTGIAARAQGVDGEFMLLLGSTVASEVRTSDKYAASTASAYAAYEATHRKLREEGSIDRSISPAVITRAARL